MEQMKVGIIGAGRIAANMAKTLDGMDDAAAYAIAARNLDRAQKFAKEWGFEKAYGSYEELVNDPEVELIYIATPHPFHIEQRLEVHILQVEKSRVKETILRNTLIRHILIKVNVFCAPCHSIQLRQV